MQIQNVEALKTWLTSRLEPICDADPAALSKYVVALVKKDKPVEELKAICIDQLEVFLSGETLEFVNVLFEALSNNSYFPNQIVEATPSSTTQEKARKLSVSEDLASKTLVEPSVPDDDDRDFKRTRKTTETNSANEGETITVPSGGDRQRKRRADSDDNRGESSSSKLARDDSGRGRGSSTERDELSTGRSRNEENVVYPILTSSRDRNFRHQDGRDFNSHGANAFDDGRSRRRSPSWDRRGPGRGFRGRDRYRDSAPPRHGDRSRDKGSRMRRERCRDYDEKGFCMSGELCPFDHGNDPVIVQDMAVLGFPGNPAGPFPPDHPGRPGPGAVVPVPGAFPMPPNSQPPPPGTGGPKGDPQGEANQDAPGVPPVPTGVKPRPVVPVSTGNPQMPITPMAPPGPAPVRLMPPVHQPLMRRDGPRPPFIHPFEDSYNPEQPQFDRQPVWMRLGNTRPPGPPMGYSPAVMRPRELLPVPPGQARMPPPAPPPQLLVQVPGKPEQTNTTGASDRVVLPPENEPNPRGPPAPENNSQSSKGRPWQRRWSDTIELKRLPREHNNISKLNEYFQRFGNIINIQVSAFNNPEAALVQFSSHEEARAAYQCPDAVLGNRFIRVFWHQPDRDKYQDKGGPPRKPGFNGSKPAEAKEENNDKNAAEAKPKPIMFQSGKTTFIKGGNVAPNPATNSPASPALAATKTPGNLKHALANVEIMKKKLEIQKQKQELLKKQIEQQKLLIAKLEKKNLGPGEKELIMKTIKTLSTNIDSLKQEVKLAAMAAKSKESPSQARQIAQKAILDQELMLMTHSGEDTAELKKKVDELKQEAKSLGLLDSPGRGRGTPRGRGRGRGGAMSRPHARVWTRESAVLDNRTRQVVVQDVASEDKDDVIEHFREFGIVDHVENGKDGTSYILTFRTRKEAEIAFYKGRKLKGRDLKILWHVPPASPTPTVTSPTSVSAKAAKTDDEVSLDFDAELGRHEEEALLLGEDFDEEEEDEDERSWKR